MLYELKQLRSHIAANSRFYTRSGLVCGNKKHKSCARPRPGARWRIRGQEHEETRRGEDAAAQRGRSVDCHQQRQGDAVDALQDEELRAQG
eukprot:760573-Hanusia_phi.AAC.2